MAENSCRYLNIPRLSFRDAAGTSLVEYAQSYRSLPILTSSSKHEPAKTTEQGTVFHHPIQDSCFHTPGRTRSTA